MYRIVLACYGLQTSGGEQAARAITADFAEHREWYGIAQCEWNGSDLILHAETDCDEDGSLTADYFRKCIEASATQSLVGANVSIESVEEVPDNV